MSKKTIQEITKIRERQNYFGITAQTFTVLGNFELTTSRVGFCFETWASVERFERGEDAITRLRREFALTSAEFNDLRDANADVFKSIEAACLAIAGVPSEGWELDYLSIQSTDKIMIVIVRNVPFGDDRRTITKTRDTYDSTIDGNLPLIGQVIGLTTGHGKQHDEFLAQGE